MVFFIDYNHATIMQDSYTDGVVESSVLRTPMTAANSADETSSLRIHNLQPVIRKIANYYQTVTHYRNTFGKA